MSDRVQAQRGSDEEGEAAGLFRTHLDRWGLIRDGDLIATTAAHLLPVLLQSGRPAMLKLARDAEERRGWSLLEWWDGEGAARLIARDSDVMLMERAIGIGSLSGMARAGQDEAACRILCAVAAKLHASRAKPPPRLIPLQAWFRDLEPAAAWHGGLLVRCREAASTLFAEPREVGVLHGDLHHGNVLDFGIRGWLAIDPKSVFGERTFDFATLFTNPDLADPTRPIAADPERFAQRLDVVTRAAGVERTRLLLWILAWTGLSASWFLAENDPLAAIDLEVAELAVRALDG